jgi:hypothetical protein
MLWWAIHSAYHIVRLEEQNILVPYTKDVQTFLSL